jgi:hypothetical protein
MTVTLHQRRCERKLRCHRNNRRAEADMLRHPITVSAIAVTAAVGAAGAAAAATATGTGTTLGTAISTAAAADLALPVDQRTRLSLTVYGDGSALVWDTRAASLAAGPNRLAFEGVSRLMLPSSAMIRADDGVRLAEIVYDFALLTPDALLRRSLGRTVGVVRIHPTTGEETVEDATLLSVEGGPVLKHRDRIEAVDPQRLVFFDMPADLRPRPALMATVESSSARRSEVTLGYLTGGLGWSADYVAVWNEAQARITLTGRATLSNTSEADFPGADVVLVAGTVRREDAPMPIPAPEMLRGRAAAAPMMADAKAMPEREQFAALHLYKVPGTVDLADRQTRQVTLLATRPIPVRPEFVSEAGVVTYRQGGEPRPTHPELRLNFDNEGGEGQAATPLPAGLVRVYAESADGAPRLLGEDRIDHTPAGAPVSLAPGEAFDITVRRRQTEFVRSGLPDSVSESAWAIEVKNAGEQAAVVRIVEVAPGDWTVLAESLPHEKETANRIVWKVPVPAGGSAQLTYRIRVQQ